MRHPKAKPKKKAKKAEAVVMEPAWESPEEVKTERSPGSIVVTFTGDPGDPTGQSDPPVLRYRGKDFPKGKPVVVDDAAWINEHGFRVRSNRHFKVEG